jgi:hypothetical protein
MRVNSSLGPAPPASGITGAPEPVVTEMLDMGGAVGAAGAGETAAGTGAGAAAAAAVVTGAGAGAALGAGAAGAAGLGAATIGAAMTAAVEADCPLMARSNRSPSGAAREATSIFGWSALGACDTPDTATPDTLIEGP